MAKPRIIIADTDINYIFPLQAKFVEEFQEKVDMEIITDKDYYSQLFSAPQKVDILVVSAELYDISLQRHSISNIFVMTEQYDNNATGDLNVTHIFKYTSIKEILNEIISKSSDVLRLSVEGKKDTEIILVYSACGGVGKTTVALGLSACLTKHYKRVLYINAAHLQSFQWIFNSKSFITGDIYSAFVRPTEGIYNSIKHVIRQELFYYLPAFKTSLMSLGIKYSIYEKIAVGAKRSADYDYIIIDADATFDEDKARLIDVADKVVIVTNQSAVSVYATNNLVANINGASGEKYIFICNDFNNQEYNALISPETPLKFTVGDYINHFHRYDTMSVSDFSDESSMQSATLLIS